MNMIAKMSVPPFQTTEQASTYLESEIERSLPSGWQSTRSDDKTLGWTVERTENRLTYYGVSVSPDLREVRISFGNTDAGPLQLHHFVTKTLIIPSGVLSSFGFGACLRHAMSLEPNLMGLT